MNYLDDSRSLKIGLDLDDTIFSFMENYLDKFGKPKTDSEITRNVYSILRKDKEFWMNLSIINRPNFKPTLYCTKRVNPKSWTKESLLVNDLCTFDKKVSPIYQLYYQHGKKSSIIKGLVDVFVDDSLSNFIEMNLNGIPCLLINNSNNINWGPIGRIYSLDYDEIEDSYELLVNTVGKNFRDLL